MFAHVEQEGPQSDVQLLFRALPERDPDAVAQSLLVRILDDGMSSRLHSALCDQRGLAYSCGALIEPLCDTALLEIDATCRHAKVAELVTLTLGIVADLCARPPDPAELARVKQRSLWDLAAAVDDPEALSGWFGGLRLYWKPDSLQTRAEKIARVAADDVLRVARRIFQPKGLTLAVAGHLRKKEQSQLERLLRCTLQPWGP